jgi:hypothetical protein
MTWIKQIASNRACAPAIAADARGSIAAPMREVAPDVFDGVLIGEKVIRDHGAAFEGVLPDMAEIARRADAMEPHRAAQLSRAVEAFYAKLGRLLSRTPIGDRVAAVEAAVKSLGGLVASVAHDEVAGPAIASLSDLIGYAADAVPKETPLSSGVIREAAEAAKTAVSALLDASEGRTGAASAFNVFPNIVWLWEAGSPSPDDRARHERWIGAAHFVAEALPRSRIDQSAAASLARHVAREVEAAPEGALERAKAKLYQETAPLYRAAREQAALVPEAARPIADAVIAVLDQNPAGPGSIGAAAEIVLAKATELAANAVPEALAAIPSLARIVARVAATPAAEPIMRVIGECADSILGSDRARAELARTETAGDLELPAVLARAQVARFGMDPDASLGGLGGIGDAPADAKMRAAIASLPYLRDPHITAALTGALLELSKNAPTAGQEALDVFAATFARVYPVLVQAIGDPRASVAADAIARTNQVEAIDPRSVEQVAEIVRSVATTMLDAPLAEMMGDDAERRPGLVSLSKVEHHRFDPRAYLTPLVLLIAQFDVPEASRLELIRWTMKLAGEIANLDRDPAALFQRVHQDFAAALRDSALLHYAMRSGSAASVRANGAPRRHADEDGVVRFLRAHPELPPEIALTAGLHLSSEQLGFLVGLLSRERRRAQVRSVRDAVLAMVEANRLDVLDAARTPTCPRDAIGKAMQFIAQEYRAGRAAEIPWNSIAAGLRQGKDPAGAIVKERAAGALAALDLGQLGARSADPMGVQLIARVLPDITGIFSVIPENQQPYGVPSERLRAPMIACLRAIAEGSWPSVKYDNDVGKRQLAGLTPKQIAIWEEEWVTPLSGDAPVEVAGPEVESAVQLLKGIGPALKKEALLEDGLTFDAASRDRLRVEVEAVRAELKDGAKGTPEHRAATSRIGPLSDALTAIDLVLALEDSGKLAGAPGSVLRAMKPLLEVAKPAARRLGARATSEAIGRVLEAVPEAKMSPRSGVFAADEDRLDAYVTSFDSGCLASKGGGNQGAQIAFIADAQYKMCRVVSDEVGVTRSVLRLYRIEIPGYSGHVLAMDGPYPVNRGVTPTAEMYRLAYKHGLKKAMAMGIPFVYGAGGGAGLAECTNAMQEAGAVSQAVAATLLIDRGNTGLHHGEGFSHNYYWISIPDGDMTFRAPVNSIQVVMPPGP